LARMNADNRSTLRALEQVRNIANSADDAMGQERTATEKSGAASATSGHKNGHQR
jgi:hypothetical protein